MSKTLTCISNSESKFAWYHSSLKTYDNFLSGFWDAKIVKREHNPETIWKSPKRILTNHFVGNLNIYSKRPNQIYWMPHPYKESVTISGRFFFAETPSILNITSKIDIDIDVDG